MRHALRTNFFVVAVLLCSVLWTVTTAARLGCAKECCPHTCGCANSCSCSWVSMFYICDYFCCTCYSCECFDPLATTGSDYWSGCSGRSMTVAGGAFGEIVDGAQTSLSYSGTSAQGQIGSLASVLNLYAYAPSTTTSVYGLVGAFYGGGYGGTIVNVYSGGKIETLSGVASNSISVAYGGTIGTATATSANFNVSGVITNIYPTSSSVYINSGGNATNIYPAGSNVYVSSGGSANLISGSGLVISIDGMVTTAIVTGGDVALASGVTVSTLRGSGTFSIGGTTTAVTITGTSTIYGTPSMVTVISVGVAVTVGSGTFAATVATLDGGGAAPTVHVYRSVGSMFSNGLTTVYGGGSITSLTHTGGTLTVSNSATVATFAVSGITSVIVDGTIGTSSASSGSSLTFSGTGTVATHQQTGGDVGVASGVTVSTLRGSGTFSIASTTTAMTITGTSKIYGTPSLVTVNSVGVVITVGSGTFAAAVATLDGGGSAPTVHVYRSVGNMFSNGLTTVYVGGLITSLTHTGGTVTVSNSATVATFVASGGTSVTVDGTIGSWVNTYGVLTVGGNGTVGQFYQFGGAVSLVGALTITLYTGQGLVDLAECHVDTIRTNGTTGSTVNIRKGATVGRFMVNNGESTSVMVVEGGRVESLAIVAVQHSAVSVNVSGSGSTLSSLVVRDATLASLLVVVTNNASIGCVQIVNATITNVTIVFTDVRFASTSCSCLKFTNLAATTVQVDVSRCSFEMDQFPVMIVEGNSIFATRLTATLSRSTMTVNRADVLQVGGPLRYFSISVVSCVVATSGALIRVENHTGAASASSSLIAVNSSTVTESFVESYQAPSPVIYVARAAAAASAAALSIVVSGRSIWTSRGGPAILLLTTPTSSADVSGQQTWSTYHVSLSSLQVNVEPTIIASPLTSVASVISFQGNGLGMMRRVTSRVSLSSVSVEVRRSSLDIGLVFVRMTGAVLLLDSEIVVAGCRATVVSQAAANNATSRGSVVGVGVQMGEDLGTPYVTGSMILVQSLAVRTSLTGEGDALMIVDDFRNVTAVAVGTDSSIINNCTIVVRCMDMPTTSVSLVDLGGVVVNSTVRVELVAIRQTETTDAAALVNLWSTNASSSENHAHIIHSNVRVPILILSATGAGVFAAGGIVLQCSYVGSMPLTSGSLSAGLASKVSPGLSTLCATTKRSVVPDAVDAMQCWSTLTSTESGSATATATATRSQTTSATHSLGAPTPSLVLPPSM